MNIIGFTDVIGSHYFVQVLLFLALPSCARDYYSSIIVCVHCQDLLPERGPKENKYDDQTNSIKPNLLNPIQASKIPVPLKMLVLIPAQCCLQQLFFFYCVVLTTHSLFSLSVFFIHSFFLFLHISFLLRLSCCFLCNWLGIIIKWVLSLA